MPWISAIVAVTGGGGGVDPHTAPQAVGEGAPAVKSAELLLVSVPEPSRPIEVELVVAAPFAVSKAVAVVPHPTKSSTCALEMSPVPGSIALAVSARKTCPAVAATAIEPLWSGVGRSWVPPVPAASWTR